MATTRHVIGVLLAVVLLLPATSRAQDVDPTSPFAAAHWLPPGSDLGDALTRTPRRVVAPGQDAADVSVRLGELAFRSPSLFGRTARRLGLACQTCHPGGHASTGFFVPGLSDRPGNVDPINGEFYPDGDDHQFRPLNIPSLRGVAATPPYGHDGRFASIEDFTRHVIVDEFGGAAPPAWLSAALVAYVRSLGTLEPPLPPVPGRGADLFASTCAGCHRPARGFTDGRQHDVGSGGRFDTPTLRNVTASAPYFHDGRYASLGEVIDHFDRQLGLGLTAGARADLEAYVAAIGGAADDVMPITLAADLDRFTDGMALLGTIVASGQGEQAAFVVRELRRQLGAIYGRFPDRPELAGARTMLIAWSRTLQDIGEAAATSNFIAAKALLDPLAAHSSDELARLKSWEPLTLYIPANLQAAMRTQ